MQGIRKTVPAVILSGLMLFSAGAMAQVADMKNTITTQGQGEMRVQPDSFEIQFSVETTAPTVEKARDENARRMQQIIAALRGLNVDGMTLQTRNVNVYPIYEEIQPVPMESTRPRRNPQVIAYRFNNTLSARVADQPEATVGEVASRVMGAGLKAGANRMQSMNFFLDDLDPVRREALQKAVQDARANAEAMAKAAGVTLSGVHSIEGSPQYGYVGRQYMEMAVMKGAGNVASAPAIPVEPGETTINSNVTVRFVFQ